MAWWNECRTYTEHVQRKMFKYPFGVINWICWWWGWDIMSHWNVADDNDISKIHFVCLLFADLDEYALGDIFLSNIFAIVQYLCAAHNCKIYEIIQRPNKIHSNERYKYYKILIIHLWISNDYITQNINWNEMIRYDWEH